MKTKNLLTLAAVIATAAAGTAQAQVIYNTAGGTYSQNFDWTTGAATSVTWVDNAAAQTTSTWVTGASSLGWYSGFTGTDTFQPTNGTANNGGSLLSNFYFGSDNTDRSLGGRPTAGNGALILGLRLTNTTGVTLNSFTLGYALEITNQRDASVNNTANFAYTIGNPANWATDSFTAATSLNATTPLVAVATNVDGNLPGNRTTVSNTINGISWANGTDLWLRWTVPNVTNGPNVGLDDLTFSAVPEPTTCALLAMGLTAMTVFRRRRHSARR